MGIRAVRRRNAVRRRRAARAILRAHTATPDRCYLGLWEGYGVPELNAFANLPRLMLPHRAYFLFLGPIDAVTSMSIGGFQHPPNLWWRANPVEDPGSRCR